MTRPRFVVAGVPKAGTTSLYHYLAAQEGVYVSDLKEINFLSYPGADVARERYPWLEFPVTTIEAYEALFAPSGDRVPIDFSPSCFRSHVAVDRMREFVPDAGVLLVLRDPVSRAWSAYQNRVRKGYERRAPDDALVPGERAVDMGFYAGRVEELQRAFGRDRVGVWLFDDLSNDAEATVRSILHHVGATGAEDARVEDRKHNVAHVPRSRALHRLFPDHARRRAVLARVPRAALRPLEWIYNANQRAGDRIPDATAARLRALYAGDVRRLEILLQRDLTDWLPVAGAERIGPH
ncbi:MAG TPA: sulfotransferase [Acidimicrobiales bacterium]|nr:sulfotransferase [Acidimicrobiales bacterium]